MQFLDWLPENDKLLKKKEIEIHNAYHNQVSESIQSKNDVFSHRKFRIDALEKAISFIDTPIQGTLLEVGAGDGWCSAYLLSQYASIQAMHTMEINDAAVQKLIPHVFKTVDVDLDKVTVVKGSFNDIQLKDTYDFAFAMGALHHSENLFKTMRELFLSLKPGGYLIAQEPYCLNDVKNNAFYMRGAQKEHFKGILEVTNNDRSDIFYRLCEYQTACYHAGFNVEILKLKKPLKKRIRNLVKDDHLAAFDMRVENMVLVCQKPKQNFDKIPMTSWEYN